MSKIHFSILHIAAMRLLAASLFGFGGTCVWGEDIALYDNIPDPLPNFTQGKSASPPTNSEDSNLGAQAFFTGDLGVVSSVSIPITNNKDAEGIIEIVLMDDDNGKPHSKITTFGTIDLGKLAKWPETTLITFDTPVSNLKPNSRYYIVHDVSGMVDPRGGLARSFSLLYQDDSSGTNGADRMLVKVDGELIRLSEELPGRNYMMMRVTASVPPAIVIDAVNNGKVLVDATIDDLEIGDEITLTAQPKEGFEFEKWLYGDEEIASNPVTITITEMGLTLTAIFAESSPPLNIDISEALAVTWDSEAAKTYQIHRSTDMETWEVAIDAIQGTGERMTHFFIREARESYYRVLESE
ncbi:MAG: hypothetical protein R3F19_23960 [Verrucomicrobiales bacterium]